MKGQIPDCVPAAPDFSYMIPVRRTGRPFWDVLLYNDPPHWKTYIDCAKHFDIDSLMDGYFPLTFEEEKAALDPGWQSYIVFKSSERIVIQQAKKENGNYHWKPTVDVYYIADCPTCGVDPAKINLPAVPDSFEPLEGVKNVDFGPDGFKQVMEYMGNQGLVGVFAVSSVALHNAEEIYHYYENPDKHEQWAQERVEKAVRRFELIDSMEVKPDFICVGGSGTLITQSPEIFRQLAFPAVKKVIELATAKGYPTHVHSCGPEKELVKIFAEETDLTVIDPLEIPPMGNCNLAELKRLYGNKIVLKGNIHTTDVMLNGTPQQVRQACMDAIDAAKEGGRFVLSTGDQCGRDTPDENIRTMVETARTYGKY